MSSSMPLVGHSLAIFVVSVVMMCVATIAVALRIFVRVYLVRAFGWDDALMMVALALFIFLDVCCIIGSQNGIGHKNEDFTDLNTYEKALLWWWLGQMLYLWSSAVAKISIALALLRLTVRRMHRIVLWVIIGVVIAIGLMFWLVLLLDCRPVSYFWLRVDLTHSGTCQPVRVLLAIAYLYSGITIFCDLTLGILPMFLIWRLQMNDRTKIALGGILSLGAVASVAVIIRLPFLHNYEDINFLYSTYQIAVWSIMETGLGITAGSLVTLRALFRWFLDGNAYYGRHGRGGKPSGGPYPLSSLTGDASKKGSRDPSYWRPDLVPDKLNNLTVTTVSSPLARSPLSEANSSQEVLNPDVEAWQVRNHVSVHRTFQVSAGE
ncbi:pectinesterase precursor [Aspergillus ibericus CBS 121593]|uniref:Pectinesterase n=1 Tax=Aspergillus ibericus CBS 121593 TaxID=1448316 RepID=A0A395GIN3_9EURO|nr:pectinesterase precursor [Aspergillus ibericus CBS 121593]RAK95321.1 pectinesterase precursor [Aspergillus ibericus CBS 121593]